MVKKITITKAEEVYVLEFANSIYTAKSRKEALEMIEANLN